MYTTGRQRPQTQWHGCTVAAAPVRRGRLWIQVERTSRKKKKEIAYFERVTVAVVERDRDGDTVGDVENDARDGETVSVRENDARDGDTVGDRDNGARDGVTVSVLENDAADGERLGVSDRLAVVDGSGTRDGVSDTLADAAGATADTLEDADRLGGKDRLGVGERIRVGVADAEADADEDNVDDALGGNPRCCAHSNGTSGPDTVHANRPSAVKPPSMAPPPGSATRLAMLPEKDSVALGGSCATTPYVNTVISWYWKLPPRRTTSGPIVSVYEPKPATVEQQMPSPRMSSISNSSWAPKGRHDV